MLNKRTCWNCRLNFATKKSFSNFLASTFLHFPKRKNLFFLSILTWVHILSSSAAHRRWYPGILKPHPTGMKIKLFADATTSPALFYCLYKCRIVGVFDVLKPSLSVSLQSYETCSRTSKGSLLLKQRQSQTSRGPEQMSPMSVHW